MRAKICPSRIAMRPHPLAKLYWRPPAKEFATSLLLIAKKKVLANCNKEGPLQQKALSFFTQDWSQPTTIKLHLKGTGFQLKVWEALLQIPMGQLRSYGRLAQELQMRGASRAVGTAIGSNPVAFLIPCHRVIQAGGTFGQYRWGATRKAALIGWEAAKANPFP